MNDVKFFTVTRVPGMTREVEFTPPPEGYAFSIEDVLDWDEATVDFEIFLARYRQLFHANDPDTVVRQLRIIAWLCITRPDALDRPDAWRETSWCLFD